MIMPWGKHKGEAIHTLPSAYLHWLATDARNIVLPLVDIIEQQADDEWQHREKNNEHKGAKYYGND